jgi:GNAT superfamily N-acetyltransferase
MSLPPGVSIRRSRPADAAEVVALAGSALGWCVGDPNEALYRWKHERNPFGASPTLVAEVGGELVGLRTLLRWEFEAPDGSTVRAVRAVDTATRPDWQGRGLFRALTLRSIDESLADGVDFVFNTPNSQSRPGYLSMGWVVLGHLPAAAALSGPGALPRLAKARVPAGKWSEPTTAGVPAADALADEAAVTDLLASRPVPAGLTTRRTVPFLRWRYCEGPVAYRAMLGDHPATGMVLFRLRRRGPALELVIDDVLVPAGPDGRRTGRRLVARARRESGADYAIRLGRGGTSAGGWIPVPGLGPILTWRALGQTSPPPMRSFDLQMGDVELF